jgi:hypothetical protein
MEISYEITNTLISHLGIQYLITYPTIRKTHVHPRVDILRKFMENLFLLNVTRTQHKWVVIYLYRGIILLSVRVMNLWYTSMVYFHFTSSVENKICTQSFRGRVDCRGSNGKLLEYLMYYVVTIGMLAKCLNAPVKT